MKKFQVKLRHHSVDEFELIDCSRYTTPYKGEGFVDFLLYDYSYTPVEVKTGVWPFRQEETLYRKDYSVKTLATFPSSDVLWVKEI